jgi:hypothetical protein
VDAFIGTQIADSMLQSLWAMDSKVTVPIYGQETQYSNNMVDGNCSLVKWSCKQNKAVSDTT